MKAGVCFLLVSLVFTGAGCHVIRTTAELPSKAVKTIRPLDEENKGADPVEVQQTLLRLADESSAGLLAGINRLGYGTNSLDAAEVLRWKVGLVTQISSIVSGPNAFANLLDLTAFITVTRMALEQHWEPKVFGEAAQPLAEACRIAESNVWRFAGTVLTPDQQKELRLAIEGWYSQHDVPESVLAMRAVGFASELPQAARPGSAKTGSVFDLLNFDLLSGLDPATREIAQTRMLAERALYIGHRTPTLLRLQAELFTLEAAATPPVQQLITNSSRITSAVERFAGIAENLPGQVDTQRREIVAALREQEGDLRLLAADIQQALVAGSQMSASLTTALAAFDKVMKRLGVGEPDLAGSPKSDAEPFRIKDYAETAAQLEMTAKQLTDLLVAFDHTLGSSNLSRLSERSGEMVQQAQSSGKRLVDYAFWKGLLFVVCALAAILAFRVASARLSRFLSAG